MLSIVVTFDVSNLLKFRFVSLLHLSNIPAIFVTFEVLKLPRSRFFRLVHFSNKHDESGGKYRVPVALIEQI